MSNDNIATIQHLPLTNTGSAFSELHDRYLNLVKMADKLPSENAIETPDNFDIDELVSMLPEDWSKDSEETLQTNNEAATTNGTAGTDTPASPDASG